jgi:hypothetical protein
LGDKLAAMHQAYDEMLGVKASIDALEARINRPPISPLSEDDNLAADTNKHLINTSEKVWS